MHLKKETSNQNYNSPSVEYPSLPRTESARWRKLIFLKTKGVAVPLLSVLEFTTVASRKIGIMPLSLILLGF